MPDPRDQEAFASWLRTKDKSWSVVIAARAALRVLPLLDLQGKPNPAAVMLTVCRCAAISRHAVEFSRFEPQDSFRSAARAASRPARAGVNPAAAGAAAAAAALTKTYKAAAWAAKAAEHAVTANAGSDLATTSTAKDLIASIRADLTRLQAGETPARLAQAKLWPVLAAPAPPWAADAWARLSAALIARQRGWEVWIGWYEDVLAGRSRVEAWDACFTDVHPDGELPWGDGPAEVNAAIKARLEKLARDPSEPRPIEGVHAPVTFGWGPAQTLRVTAGAADWPVFPAPTSAADHAQRLDTCRVLAEDLVAALASQRYQVRPEYREQIGKYRSRLPHEPGTGQILLADAAARSLRALFAAEAEVLASPFAADLKVLLEAHLGLRPYYPEIERFYQDVRSGRLAAPLPLDAVDGIAAQIRAHTPDVFEPDVAPSIEEAGPPPPPGRPAEAPPLDPSAPQPPPDPLGDLDPKASSDYGRAGAINALWKAFQQGETIAKNIEAWRKAFASLKPHIARVLDWLRDSFPPGGGDLPPMPPMGTA